MAVLRTAATDQPKVTVEDAEEEEEEEIDANAERENAESDFLAKGSIITITISNILIIMAVPPPQTSTCVELAVEQHATSVRLCTIRITSSPPSSGSFFFFFFAAFKSLFFWGGGRMGWGYV